jgi:lipoprotein-anchoring transpeptidase ErfK/SrfK
MEDRLGHDFSNVKVHTDMAAADSAKAVNALAYTVGEHIVFDSGNYNPQTTNGKKLLIHELTHVRQQSNRLMFQTTDNDEASMSPAEKAMEQEAVEMEEQITDDPGTDYVDEPGLEGVLPNPGEEELVALLASNEEGIELAQADAPPDMKADESTNTDSNLLAQAPKPAKRVVVDLGKQTATATEDGKAVKTMPISSGKKGHETTPGKDFPITTRDEDHRSTKYGKCVSAKGKRGVSNGAASCKKGEKYEGAPMKYFQRFNGAEGFHKGELPGHPDSHGCVRLSEGNAKWLWDWAESGTLVDVIAPAKKKPAKKASPPKKAPTKGKKK